VARHRESEAISYEDLQGEAVDRKSFGSGVRAAVLRCGLAIAPMVAFAQGQAHSSSPVQAATPIKHLIVIFQENVSFDHYFATYPNALRSILRLIEDNRA
jgi:phospholipase C